VHVAFAEFMDVVYLKMTEAERPVPSSGTLDFVNAIVSYALHRLPEFGELLAETVARVYDEGPSGERFIRDSKHSTALSEAILFLDNDGQLVSVNNPELVQSATAPGYFELKGFESCRVLTGPSAGRRFSALVHPLGSPVYRPGLVASATKPILDDKPRPSGALVPSAHDASEDPDPARLAKNPARRTGVFISYSHKDKKWLERLQVHLKPLEKLGTIAPWDDTMLNPGDNWRDEIKQAINSAKIAVLLISADFISSDFIQKDELPPLLAAAQTEGAVILPVIVSPCRFKETKSLSQFQAVNEPARPLIMLNRGQRDKVFVEVVKAIEDRLGP
jgi:hypothetical protein